MHNQNVASLRMQTPRSLTPEVDACNLIQFYELTDDNFGVDRPDFDKRAHDGGPVSARITHGATRGQSAGGISTVNPSTVRFPAPAQP